MKLEAKVLAISASDALNEFAVAHVSDLGAAIDLARQQKPAVILLDRDLPGNHWAGAMKLLLAASPRSCVVLASSVNDAYLWSEVASNGGYDVINKPLNNQQVQRTIALALAHYEMTPFRTA